MTLYLRYLAVGLGTLCVVLIVALVGSADILREPNASVLAYLRYVGVSGALAISVGILGVVVGMRFLPRLSLKVAVAYAIGSVGAIFTVAYTPLLMFKDSRDLHTLILLLVCFMVISLGLGSIIAIGLTHHLEALRLAARRVAAGKFDTRVEVPSGDEISELGEAFNRMSHELGIAFQREKAVEQGRRDLVAAISHDLRTPLASIRALLEAMQDGIVRDEATIQAYHLSMHQQVERLSRLIDELFELSRLDSGLISLNIENIDVRELIAETVESLRPAAEQRQLGLTLEEPTHPLSAYVDASRLQRVVANLVENSIRHTPPGGSIRVKIHPTGPEVAVEVIDSGEGISSRDSKRIFDRFYRGEKSRTRADAAGAGLGLAIAKAIVEAHRGRIWVEETPERGATFVFTLPMASAA